MLEVIRSKKVMVTGIEQGEKSLWTCTSSKNWLGWLCQELWISKRTSPRTEKTSPVASSLLEISLMGWIWLQSGNWLFRKMANTLSPRLDSALEPSCLPVSRIFWWQVLCFVKSQSCGKKKEESYKDGYKDAIAEIRKELAANLKFRYGKDINDGGIPWMPSGRMQKMFWKPESMWKPACCVLLIRHLNKSRIWMSTSFFNVRVLCCAKWRFK